MKRLHKSMSQSLVVLLALSGVAIADERGSDGELRIQYSQAPSILNPYLSTGTKDSDPASMVVEPLAYYDHLGQLVPVLAEEIPSVSNGGVSEDLMSITWTLKEGIKWSDGTDLTAEDVVFTGDYCLDPNGGCASANNFADVEKVEALDDRRVKITFAVKKPYPYGPFVSSLAPILQKKQFENCVGEASASCTNENFYPVGTGPYVVKDFRANDVILFEANELYREADKPAFATVTVKGGGDAMSAARSVMETGEFDFAWNIQAEPEIIEQLERGGKGKAVPSRAATVERLMVQLTDVNPDLGDARGTIEGGEHPFLSDVAVRKALSLAIDRQAIVDVGYGDAGDPTCNIIAAPPHLVSEKPASCTTGNVEEAIKLLDEAGWTKGADGVREKDGVRLSILFQTSTNSVRQSTQALIKQAWEKIGVETELRNINAGVFFSTDVASPDTYTKFFADIQMYAGGFGGGDPESYLNGWACNAIPTPKNQWLGQNTSRYCSEEFDAMLKQLATTAEFDERAETVKKLNDMLIEAYVVIPLVHRGIVSAVSNSLTNVEVSDWDATLAFVENWKRAE